MRIGDDATSSEQSKKETPSNVNCSRVFEHSASEKWTLGSFAKVIPRRVSSLRQGAARRIAVIERRGAGDGPLAERAPSHRRRVRKFLNTARESQFQSGIEQL